MSGKTREQQLDELLDKQAIYELIMAYCNAADRHDHVKMRTLYHEDAIDDHGHFAKGLAMEFIDKLPEIQKTEKIREPIITAHIFVPQDYLGPVLTLCNQKRGVQIDLRYHGRQVHAIFELPMNEVVMDFFDRLKSVSRGYASLDYEFKEYRPADLVKLDVLVNG